LPALARLVAERLGHGVREGDGCGIRPAQETDFGYTETVLLVYRAPYPRRVGSRVSGVAFWDEGEIIIVSLWTTCENALLKQIRGDVPVLSSRKQKSESR
jgi:hypothetical protein